MEAYKMELCILNCVHLSIGDVPFTAGGQLSEGDYQLCSEITIAFLYYSTDFLTSCFIDQFPHVQIIAKLRTTNYLRFFFIEVNILKDLNPLFCLFCFNIFMNSLQSQLLYFIQKKKMQSDFCLQIKIQILKKYTCNANVES